MLNSGGYSRYVPAMSPTTTLSRCPMSAHETDGCTAVIAVPHP